MASTTREMWCRYGFSKLSVVCRAMCQAMRAVIFGGLPVAGHRFADADSESHGVVDLLVSAF